MTPKQPSWLAQMLAGTELKQQQELLTQHEQARKEAGR